MKAFGWIVVIALVAIAYLYFTGNATVVNGLNSLVGIGTTDQQAEPQWTYMLDIEGFPLTCSSNAQCADYYVALSGQPRDLALETTRCFKLRCEFLKQK